jgi:hypothetical protein
MIIVRANGGAVWKNLKTTRLAIYLDFEGITVMFYFSLLIIF